MKWYLMNVNRKTRVLVVEDSSVKKELLIQILHSDPDIEVIGSASSGREALEFLKKTRPDVITMDIHMSGIDGFETSNQIMSSNPVPIVIISSLRTNKNKKDFMDAMLSAGALYFLDSPHGPWHPNFEKDSNEIVKIVKLMSKIKTFTRIHKRKIPKKPLTKISSKPKSKIKLIAIGASTGGPGVLEKILLSLPQDFTVPIIIVLHIGSGFDLLLLKYFENKCKRPVHLAEDGSLILAGHVYFAQGGKHLRVCSAGRISISEVSPDYKGNIPSIDLFLQSVNKWYGDSATGILLSGMGHDGCKELKLLRDKGAVTIVQDGESYVVDSMPREAVKINAADYTMTPEEISQYLLDLNT